MAAIFFVSMLTVNMCLAAVPAPPVNQQQGVPDHNFSTMSEPVCRACHNQNPPPGIPVSATFLPNRHHTNVGLSIPAETDIPNPDADNDGVPDTTYTCANCHDVIFDQATQTYMLSDLSDCMQCHVYSEKGSVHHRSSKTLNLDCKACHGGLVNNHPTLGSNPDGHYIPTYAPSRVTPWPSGKPNGDSNQPPSSAGTYAGNCDYCHNTVDGTIGGGDPVQTPIGLLTIDKNRDTHHSAAVGFLDLPGHPPCMVCHDFFGQPGYAIRTCENCHGVETLHGIAADSNGDGVHILNEDPGYSHVGSLTDCWGCHGTDGRALDTGVSVRVIPRIDSMSDSDFSAGADSIITLRGANFIGYEKNPWTGTNDVLVTPVIQLVNSEGNITELEPTSVADSSLQVLLPGSMPPGNYRIVVNKAGTESIPMSLVIKPAVAIVKATCSGKTLSLEGSGFGDYSSAANSGTSIALASEDGRVISWSDTTIRVNVNGCNSGDVVTVNSVFGSATSIVD